MKTNPPSTRHLAVGTFASALLAVAGGLYTPAAQATISCQAQNPRVNVSTNWSTPLNYYEVPVGGALTRKSITITSRLSKTGTNTEEVLMRLTPTVRSGQWWGAPVNGATLLVAPGLALRISIGALYDGRVVDMDMAAFNSPHTDYLFVQRVDFEIVRTNNAPTAGTRWQLSTETLLPHSLTFALRSPQGTIGGAANCQSITLSTFGHIGTTRPELPGFSPAPITCTLTLNNENNHAIDFGTIRLEDLHTVDRLPQGFAKRPIDVHYICHNTSTTATLGYRLGWHGTAATGVTTALQVTDPNNGNRVKNGLGVVMEVDTTPPLRLPINTTGNNRIAAPNAGHENGNTVRLYAYPIRTDNSQITSGPFRANATVRIDLF